ncbi:MULTISPECIES: methyltransferase [Nostocales]|uniref:Methyltransferase n=3 Tax=Nostocales TaxID=1161 RepID=A0A0C1R3B6_9CYAN|nr:methyltransferase [Tolypothrix bouteillei]KAF3889874.1 methyltransferase [Tolypothrix bouteillei VB521301]
MLQQEKPQALQNTPAQAAMLQMITGSWLARSIYAAAKLGIADLLKESPKSCEELANAVFVRPKPLYRLLRALASVGVFAEEQQGYFTLTPLATCLISDRPGSLRSLAMMLGSTEFHQAWGDILYSLQTEKSAFEHLYGMSLFQYYTQNAETARIFDEAMTAFSTTEIAGVIANYDFSKIHKLVDIGGGQGLLIASILKAYPAMEGILFDLPSVIASSKNFIEIEEIKDRCSVVEGNFFELVPSGGDAYILKRIVHDWDDESAVAILNNCHCAMQEKGKLLLVEMVIPPGNEPFFGKFLDLELMTVFGGRERTEKEYRELLEAAGFQLTGIIPTGSYVSVIEGVKM